MGVRKQVFLVGIFAGVVAKLVPCGVEFHGLRRPCVRDIFPLCCLLCMF